MTDRQGVEIDYCPECRGVWLDRTVSSTRFSNDRLHRFRSLHRNHINSMHHNHTAYSEWPCSKLWTMVIPMGTSRTTRNRFCRSCLIKRTHRYFRHLNTDHHSWFGRKYFLLSLTSTRFHWRNVLETVRIAYSHKRNFGAMRLHD